jgi:N6-adenosine-specific RNA methylase IME4
MPCIKPAKRGTRTYYQLWDKHKFIRHIGNADKLAGYLESLKAGKELVEILQKRPDLISTMGNAPKRAFSANRNYNLKRVTNPIPVGDIYYADPPWKYDFSETITREIENQYPTMELEDIKSLKNIIPAPNNCVLFLWATAPKLIEALEVMKEWGFNYKTHAIWDKEKIGMGYWFRGQHELLLVGTKGDMSPPAPEFRSASVFKVKRTGHSVKPPEIYDEIERMLPNLRYVELFARNKHNDKWLVWGNEA